MRLHLVPEALRRMPIVLFLFLVPCTLYLVPDLGHAATVTLAWDDNTEPDLAGYKIFYGTSSGNYSINIDAGNVTEYTISSLNEGTTYYFAARAYDYMLNESSYSEEIVHAVASTNHKPNKPSTPTGTSNGVIQTTYSYKTSGSDPDGDSLLYRFDWGDGQISGWNSVLSQTHSWSSTGNFCVKAQAKDSHSAISDWSECFIIDIFNSTFTITATAGAYGDISPSGSVSVSHGVDRTFSINPEQNYHIVDVVVDGVSKGAVTSYTFSNVTQNHTIAASFAFDNHPPTANAGPDKTVKGGVIVKLSALGSTDPDDGIAGYSWKQTGGKAVALSNPGIPEPIFISPTANPENVTLAFELTVTDNGGLKDTDSCATRVIDSASIDSDGDGVTDDLDTFPDDPGEWEDTDSDSIGNNADTDDDNDGVSDTDETLKYGTDPLNPDSDGDGYDDGEEISSGTDPLDPDSNPDSNPSSFSLEVGEIKVNHAWTRVGFEKSFVEPIVVAGSFSMNDGNPGVIRIRNADSTGFDIRIQEWDYLDGQHASETVYYIVVERGVYSLADGTRVEADRFEASKVSKFESVSFVKTFQHTPVVITSVSGFNEADAVTGRTRNVTTDTFQYCLQEQEKNRKAHLPESVNYIAWEPSKGTIDGITFQISTTGNKVSHNFHTINFNQTFTEAPVFLSDMQTANGMDTANVRWRNNTGNSVQVQIDEEQSRNRETKHLWESVGYMVFSK